MRLDQPLIFEPILKRARWGGTRLASLLAKPLGQGDDYAESWETADLETDQSLVASGPFAGLSLRQLLEQQNQPLMGRHSPLAPFPILVKFLDVCDWLSVQVHPDDHQAKRSAGNATGKTEAWVILECRTDSQIYLGLKEGVDQQILQTHLTQGTIPDCLNLLPVRPGDCFFVPAGTVHAIGPGIVLAEIQQQSNLTYRLYDWNRLDRQGNPRQLHIEQALQCIDYGQKPFQPIAPRILLSSPWEHARLIDNRYFCIDRFQAENSFPLEPRDQFHIFVVLAGSGHFVGGSFQQPFHPGSTVLIPAAVDRVEVVVEEKLTMLDVFLP